MAFPINSTSNTITGVIPGVTLNLEQRVDHDRKYQVAPDTTRRKRDQLRSFRPGTRSCRISIPSSPSARLVPVPQPLESDGTVRDAQQQLLSAITYSIGGNNGFVNLASIGVNLNNDGTITVDSAALSNALPNNFSSVQDLLQGTSGVAYIHVERVESNHRSHAGTITLDLQGMAQTVKIFRIRSRTCSQHCRANSNF